MQNARRMSSYLKGNSIMFRRQSHKKWWPGCDVYYAYQAGHIPQDKFQRLTLHEGIRYIKKYYPKTATLFSLDKNEFRYGFDGLTEIVSAIPDQITTLSLNVYGLHGYSDVKFQVIFAPLAKQITSIYLNYFDYDNEREDYQFEHLKNTHPGDELAHLLTVMRLFNFNITAINIGCELKLDEWINVLQSIPSTVNFANISPIHALGADGIKQVLQYIPQTVTTVEISRNNLNQLGADDLAQIIQQLPRTVTTLDLKLDQLHLLGKDGVSKLIQAIPSHLTVKFDYNNIEQFGFTTIQQGKPSAQPKSPAELTLFSPCKPVRAANDAAEEVEPVATRLRSKKVSAN